MRKMIDDEKRLNDLIIDIQREPKQIKKRAFGDALKLLTRDTHEDTLRKLIFESVRRLGGWHVSRAIYALPDSHVRNELLRAFASDWSNNSDNRAPFATVKGMVKQVIGSEFATAEQLSWATRYDPSLTKLSVKPALLLAAEERPGSVCLLLELADSNRLKRKQRLRLASAVLGMSNATIHDLMKIVRGFPELRQDAGAIVLTRAILLQPEDIALLLSYDATKDLVEIMLPTEQ